MKTVLVTGGTRGIGRAIVQSFLPDHNVAYTWRNTPPQEPDDACLAVRVDLSDADAADMLIDQVITRFGRLDVIVNNAGIVNQTPKDRFPSGAATAVVDVNLLAPARLLSAALPYLKEGGAIINISSMNAQLPPREAAIYGASKAALNLWTKAMAKELGPDGIRVNAVAPGAIDISDAPRPDDLIDVFVQDTALGRIGTPKDIAGVVRFLASDQAGFITGEVVTVSGGYRL